MKKSTEEMIQKKSDEKDATKAKKHVHKKSALSAGEVAEIIAGGTVAVGAVAYLKSIITSWSDKLTNAVADRAEEGGDNALADIEAIIAKANTEIDVGLSTMVTKADETNNESAIKLKDTIELVKSTVTHVATQIQVVATEAIASNDLDVIVIHDKLIAVVKPATIEVDHALEKCDSEIIIKVEKKKVIYCHFYL